MEHNKFCVCVWAIVLTASVLIAGIVAAGYYYQTKLFVSAGYCEQAQIGTATARWVKCE